MSFRVLYVVYSDILSNVYYSQMEPLWKALTKHGVQLKVFAALSPLVFLRQDLRSRLTERRNSSSVSIETSFFGAGFPPRFGKVLELRLQSTIKTYRPQVLHARGPIAAGIAAKAISKFPKEFRPKLVFDVRGDTLAEIELGGLIPKDKHISKAKEQLKKLEVAACRKADTMLCVSLPLFAAMRERYDYQRAIFVIPCWAEVPEQFSDPSESLRSEIRRELQIGEDTFLWCYAGSTAKWQALPETLDLITRLNSRDGRHKILLLTDDAVGMRNFCRKAGLLESAFVIRSGNRAQAIRWMSGADAAILLRENNAVNRVACPMKFADYLLAGLPILVSDEIGDISRWVKQYNVGEVAKSLQGEGLIQPALKLATYKSESKRAHFRKVAKNLYDNELNLNSFAPQYLEIYGAPKHDL